MKERFKLFLRPLFLYLSGYLFKPFPVLTYLLKDGHSTFTDPKFALAISISSIDNEKPVE